MAEDSGSSEKAITGSPAVLQQLPLSLEEEEESSSEIIMDESSSSSSPPLDARIISIVKSCPDFTIRPARLATELGISVNDACAELCGLLSAVGGGYDGGSFRFESMEGEGQQAAMVFTFPPDFERRALRKRQREDFWKMFKDGLRVAVKVIQILTAFGLILSLFILCLAAMAGLIVAIVAMSRDNRGSGGHHRTMLMRQLRSLFFTVRQLLWCYALIGPDHTFGEGEHPFLREMAYDMALISSLCCSSPTSWYFWFRASQLRRRRHRIGRGWGRHYDAISGSSRTTSIASGQQQYLESEIEGVTLIRRSDNSNSSSSSAENTSNQGGEHRGLLSVAVEFLFGPSPFHPGPSEPSKWKLRGAAIIHLSTQSQGAGVSLEQLIPFMEDPPKSLEETTKIVEGGLPIVAHFNGIPAPSNKTISTGEQQQQPSKARFLFPELMAESNSNHNNAVAMRYNENVVRMMTIATTTNENDNNNSNYDTTIDAYSSWESLLYTIIDHHHRGHSQDDGWGACTYLRESPYSFTKLQRNQFFHCLCLGLLNLIGVIWLKSSLEPGGMLEIPALYSSTIYVIKDGLMRILVFYAYLFFTLPGIRLILVVLWNHYRQKRNMRRLALSKLIL